MTNIELETEETILEKFTLYLLKEHQDQINGLHYKYSGEKELYIRIKEEDKDNIDIALELLEKQHTTGFATLLKPPSLKYKDVLYFTFLQNKDSAQEGHRSIDKNIDFQGFWVHLEELKLHRYDLEYRYTEDYEKFSFYFQEYELESKGYEEILKSKAPPLATIVPLPNYNKETEELVYIPNDFKEIVSEAIKPGDVSKHAISLEGAWEVRKNFKKLKEDILTMYNQSQVVNLVSNHEFQWNIKGDEYKEIKCKTYTAKIIGVLLTSSTGEQYTATMPSAFFTKFIEEIDEISFKNFIIKQKNLAKIEELENSNYTKEEVVLTPYIENYKFDFNKSINSYSRSADKDTKKWADDIKQGSVYNLFEKIK